MATKPKATQVISDPPVPRWVRGLMPLVLFAAVIASYWPALRAGFIWDDDGHVTRAELRSVAGLEKIWFSVGATQQYYPVVHTAFWIEHRLWGDAPAPYHLANLLAHALAACLCALVIERLLSITPTGIFGRARIRYAAGWASAFLFALHPLAVETVAWISEEKNTLSAIFYFSAAFVYLRFRASGSWGTYALASVFYLASILTKSVTVTLPAALLVALWWRTGRVGDRRDRLALVPWIVAGVAMGLITAWFEARYIGARGASFSLSPLARVALAGHVAWFYFGTWAWPTSLLFIYPHWIVLASDWEWLWPGSVVGVLGVGLWLVPRERGVLAAALLYLGTLFPALGFICVYPFVFSYVADHFAYLGAMVLDATLVVGVLAWLGGRARPRLGLAAGVTAALAAILGASSFAYARSYQSAETLYRTTLAGNPTAWLAQGNLGALLLDQGHVEEAVPYLERARALNPGYPEPANNLANAYARLHRYEEALSTYAEAVRLRPTYTEAYLNWGNTLSDMGRYSEAIERYHAALALQPNLAAGYYHLANAYANGGDMGAAIAGYEKALSLVPAYPEAEANLGLALVQTGRLSESLPHLEAAVRLRPSYAEAHAYLAFAEAKAGRNAEAIDEYRASLVLNPNDADVHYQLALVLRAAGRMDEAVEEQNRARSLTAGR